MYYNSQIDIMFGRARMVVPILKNLIKSYTYNYIVLIIGESGSGKSTLARELEQSDIGLTQVISYTTRKPREGERNKSDHIFITEEQFHHMKDKFIAYTNYNGSYYGATLTQIEKGGIYVIDEAGLITFEKNYRGNKIPIVLRLDVAESVRRDRMLERGDSPELVEQRIAYDKFVFTKKAIMDSKFITIKLPRVEKEVSKYS